MAERSRAAAAGIAVALAAATLWVFAGVLSNGFIRFDDPRYVTQNPIVLDGLTRDGAVWAFTTFFKSNWHPLTWLSHMLDVELFGTDPAGHHATSLLLHVANALLLFLVLRAATRDTAPSAFVAALFAVHPTHVESVAWVAERKDVLSTCFALLAIACYVGYARRGGALRYGATLALLALGLASKTSLVTLPFALLLLDYWPLDRLRAGARVWLEKLPMLALAAVVSLLTMHAQSASGATGFGAHLTLAQRGASAVMSYATYVAKTLWPTRLSILYPHPYLAGGAPWPAWQIAAAGLALAAATLACALARRRRYLAVGWLWFGGTLVPMIGLVQAGTQGVADRYTYVSCIGLYVIAAWGGADLLAWLRLRSRPLAALALGAFAGCVVVLGATAREQVSRWHDTITLFEYCLRVAPGAAFLHNNLGNELFERGEIDASVPHHRAAVALMPEMRLYHRNLSLGLVAQGKRFEARAQQLLAQGVDPASVEGQLELARVRLEERDYAGARALMEHAVEIGPGVADAHVGLSLALALQGEREASERALERGLEQAADPADVALVLARMRIDDGDVSSARALLARAEESDALPASHRAVLAQSLLAVGDVAAAVAQLRRAIDADPSAPDAYVLLADALLASGDAQGAITWYRQAVILAPESEEIRARLARALAARHSSAEPGPR